MKKKTKKSLIEYGVIIAIFGGLYITGLHTEVLGFLQRGILATGIMNPDLEKEPLLADNSTYPQADFSMNLINSKGEKVAMEELRGKVIFMNIWATWCPPCIAEMPGINKLYKDIDKDRAITLASYIIAEYISDNAYYRKWIRNYTYKHGVIRSSKSKNASE